MLDCKLLRSGVCAVCCLQLSSLNSPTPAHLCPPPSRYVLVKADTLEVPTESQLRSARRQVGEPSVSLAPVKGQPEPASAARSRPAAAAAAAAVAAEEEAAMPSAAMLAAMSKQPAKLVRLLGL